MKLKLDKLNSDWKLYGLNLSDKILNNTYKLNLSEGQKIVIMDFAIGIVRSDKSMQKSEISFINTLMQNIKISTEIVEMRYGNWWIIETNN